MALFMQLRMKMQIINVYSSRYKFKFYIIQNLIILFQIFELYSNTNANFPDAYPATRKMEVVKFQLSNFIKILRQNVSESCVVFFMGWTKAVA